MKAFDDAMRLLESSGEDIPAHWITASPFTNPTITKTECGDFQLSMEPMDATENLEAIRREIQVRVFKLVNKPKGTSPIVQLEGQITNNDSIKSKTKSTPTKSTQKVIDLLKQGLDYDTIHERTGKSVKNIRQIKSRYVSDTE